VREVRLAGLLVAYVLLSTSGLLLLRHALDSERSPDDGLLSSLASPQAVAGGVLYVASFLVWLLALQREPVTVVYPVFVGAGVVGVVLAGWLVLGEPFGAAHAAGALAVIAGVVILTR
jgi:multidrug transporter EmrE-like cation transporter